jgi:outer membrane lipoprotein-sorting protein
VSATLIVVSLFLGASPVAAALAPTPELVALKEKLAKTVSLEAKFVQKRHWAALKDPLVTEGSFSYQKPDRIRWRTLPPNESELVLTGKRAQMRFPALGTEQEFDLGADPGLASVLDSIMAVLQADVDRLLPIYELTVVKKSPLQLGLKPRSDQVAKVVERIELTFDSKLFLTLVVLHESGGDWTEIAFRDQVANGKSR